MRVNEETSTGLLLSAGGLEGAAMGDGSPPTAAARPLSMERRVRSATGSGWWKRGPTMQQSARLSELEAGLGPC